MTSSHVSRMRKTQKDLNKRGRGALAVATWRVVYLVVRVPAVPPPDDDDADDHGGHHGDAGERQGHVDRVVVAHLHPADRVALEKRSDWPRLCEF